MAPLYPQPLNWLMTPSLDGWVVWKSVGSGILLAGAGHPRDDPAWELLLLLVVPFTVDFVAGQVG